MSIIKNIFFKNEPYNLAEVFADAVASDVIYSDASIKVGERVITDDERKVLADGLIKLIGESGVSPNAGEGVMEYIDKACMQIAKNEFEELADLKKELAEEDPSLREGAR